MSNSYRKTPIFPIASTSDKKDKQLAHRSLRKRVRDLLRQGLYELLPELREISNVWGFAKDGKRYDSTMRMNK